MIEVLSLIHRNGKEFAIGEIMDAGADEAALVEVGAARYVEPTKETAEVLAEVEESEAADEAEAVEEEPKPKSKKRNRR